MASEIIRYFVEHGDYRELEELATCEGISEKIRETAKNRVIEAMFNLIEIYKKYDNGYALECLSRDGGIPEDVRITAGQEAVKIYSREGYPEFLENLAKDGEVLEKVRITAGQEAVKIYGENKNYSGLLSLATGKVPEETRTEAESRLRRMAEELAEELKMEKV